VTLQGGAAGSRLHKADTAICTAETSRRQGTWKRTCKPTQRGRCKRRNGRRQADLGEKAPGSVKSGLNGFCHSAAQPLIYVGTGCGGILDWRIRGDCRVKSAQSGRVGGGDPHNTGDSSVLVLVDWRTGGAVHGGISEILPP